MTPAAIIAAKEKTMSDTLWCIHVDGPDDVIAAPSYTEAARRCLEINAEIVKYFGPELATDENMPWIFARPDTWPWSAESHAESLAKNPAMVA